MDQNMRKAHKLRGGSAYVSVSNQVNFSTKEEVSYLTI